MGSNPDESGEAFAPREYVRGIVGPVELSRGHGHSGGGREQGIRGTCRRNYRSVQIVSSYRSRTPDQNQSMMESASNLTFVNLIDRSTSGEAVGAAVSANAILTITREICAGNERAFEEFYK